MIVTTLRRYHRRGASAALLERIAGGPAAWRILNDFWQVDGLIRGPSSGDRARAPNIDAPMGRLCGAERRIALVQLADEFAEARAAFPPRTQLGHFFGVSPQQISWDLNLLARRGEIADRLTEDAHATV